MINVDLSLNFKIAFSLAAIPALAVLINWLLPH